MQQNPMILALDDAKTELIQCVNDIIQKHGLNCYLIESMFAELYAEVKAGAHRELAQARAQEAARQQTMAEAATTQQND